MKKSLTLAVVALLALFAAPKNLLAQQTHWTAGGTNLNWSDPDNWSFGTPNSGVLAYFEDGLYPNAGTNASGLVNNIVEANYAAGGLAFTSQSGPTGPVSHHYTTLIPGGVTLTLGGLGSSGPALAVGDVPGSQWLSAGTFTNYSTITGQGNLLVNDAASLISVGQRNRATLDLNGLNTFDASFKQLLVGATADNPTATAIVGALLLGKTNTVTTTANTSAPGILIGSFNLANSTGILTLGGTNFINTDGLTVGGRRATSTLLAFGSAYSNTPTAGNLILRGSAGGSSRVGTFSVGDMAAQPTDYLGTPAGSSTAVADFSGGTVDIRADSIYVGRSAAGDVSGGGFQFGFGTLIVERGTVDANNLYIAYKQGTNASSSLNGSSSTLPCPVTLKSNAQMTVNGDIVMAFRNNGAFGSQIPCGALIVNDSATVSIGGNLTTPTNGISFLQLGGGTVTMTGGGNLTNTTLLGTGTVAGANNIMVVSNLVIGDPFSASTLNLGGNLTLGTAFPIAMDLGATNTVGSGINDYLNVTGNVNFNNNPIYFTYGAPLLAGSNYTVITYTGSKTGSLTFTNDTRSQLGLDQSTAGQVSLVVTNWAPATLTWQGTAVTNMHVWSTATNLYWTNNAGGADKFYQGDAVVFNDTAINPIVYPNGLLFPASIVVDCTTKHIMITNRNQGAATGIRGVIGGNCSITKNGPGTLTFGTFSNTFTGPFNVNNGVVRLHDPNFSTPAHMPTLGSTLGTMYINSGGTLDFFGVGSTATGKPLVINGTGYAGLGVITNGSTSGAVNGFAVTLAGDSTISADVSALGLRSTSAASTAPLFSGYLNLNGYTLTKLGGNRFSLQDVVATNSGSINVVTGNLAVANCIIEGPGSINLSNSTYMSLGIQSTLSTVGYVAKTLNVYNAGLLAPASGGSAAPTAIVNSAVNLFGPISITNAQPIAMNGIIDGASNLIKYGNSNLLLNAANTYSGQTLINAGILTLGAGGSINNSPLINIPAGVTMDVTAKAGTYAIAPAQTLNLNGRLVGDATVNGGGTLLGSGVVNGSLTLDAGSETALATTNVTGTMVVSNNLTLNNAHLTWEFAPSFDISDALVVGGNLTLTGTNRFTISSIGGFDPSGTNTLITYTGTLSGGLTNLALDTTARFVVEFVDPATTPGAIKLRLITPSPLLTWKGGNSSNPINWDIQTTTNWDNGGSPDIFYPSDEVRFDDSANTNIVQLVGTIGPASISMENALTAYFIGGSGALISSSLTNVSGSLTLSNAANNFFTGVGLVLNGGSLTMAQPSNSTLTANLNGGGTFNKAAASTLTLIGNAANYNGALNVNAGTLRAGNSNVLGVGTTTVTTNATLDLNGQALNSATINVVGPGVNGWGAINNGGSGRTNALSNVTLTGPTTFGALSNGWGIVDSFNAAGYALTKTNVHDVWLMTGSDTALGDVEVRQGRLVVARPGTTLGNAANTVTVRSGATLSLAATNIMPQSGPGVPGVDAGDKPFNLLAGSTFESIGFPVNQTTINSHSGPVTITTNGVFKVGGNSILMQSGPISGNGHLTVTNGGTLYLGGTNSYASNTFVYSGTLVLSNAASLPGTSILNVSNNTTVGNASLAFQNSPVFTNILRVSSLNGIVSVGGDGIWNGPIFMHGSNTFSLSGGETLLDLAGPMITTNAGGSFAFHGSKTRVRGALIVPSASVSIGVGDGLGAAFNERFTTVTFDKSNVWTGTMVIDRGRVNLGTNNALPINVPIRVGTLALGVSDRRIIFDLGGYSQVISNLSETAVGDSTVLIGNSSETSDSLLTVTSATTNTWAIRIVDDLDSPATPHKTALTVTAGTLNLVNTNTYTGPTLITGGTVNLNLGSGLNAGRVGQLGSTHVTISGSGTLGGNGIVAGPITVNSGGSLSPGTSVGQLTIINEDIAFNTGGKFVCEVDLGAGTNDNVVGINTLTLGGTIQVSNVGVQPFTNGTVLKLFDAVSYVSGPVSVLPVSPGYGLWWDTSDLAVNGTLKVIPAVTPVIADITRLGDGNISFTLTGTTGQVYSVHASTNVTLPLASWTVIQSGPLTVSPFTFTDLTATNYPARYYRASTP